MSKRHTRANGRELKVIKSWLVKRCIEEHGKLICDICKNEKTERQLIIEHKDNDFLNWHPENLHLACQSCNIKKDPPYRNPGDIDNVRDGVRVFVQDLLNDEIKPRTAEMQRNMRSEPAFISWLKREMNKKLRMELEDVINSGAHISEVSVDTTRRYLKKLTSRLGPYNIELDSSGMKWLVWKTRHMPFKELIKKHCK